MNPHTKKSISFVVLALCCAVLLVACEQNVSDTESGRSRKCTLNLHIVVRQGAHANQSFAGTAALKNASSISASTLEGEGSSDPISFYFDGPALHFMLQTDQGRVFGTGLMESGPATCNGAGGGTQSGPAEGDLGDWRGEWVLTTTTIATPIPESQPFIFFQNPILGICISALVILLIVAATIWLFRPYKSGKKLKSSPKSGPVQKSDEKSRMGALVEYTTTYTQDDELFDLSFPIENAGEYLGEYGINIAKAFGVKSDKVQVIALEVWMFDKNGSQSASKILMSEFAYGHDALKKEMELKGSVVAISAGETIEIETASLRLQASILEVEYDTSQPNPRTIFKEVTMKIGVWPKSS